MTPADRPFTASVPWLQLGLTHIAILTAASSFAVQPRPNFVIILADDLGYSDLPMFGNSEIPSPHLSRMADEGVRFTQAYTAAPICVPSRMALLSGRHAQRFGVYDNVYSRLQNRLWIEQVTLADVLQQAGYRTANVGKWHLSGNSSVNVGAGSAGFRFKPPHERGFDEFVGITGGMSDSWKGAGLARWMHGTYERFESPEYLTDFFGAEACDFIRRNQSQPFFLYLAFTAPHAPLQGLDEDQRAIASKHISPDRRKYAAMVRAIDRNVGRVLDLLRDLKLDDTFVVFLNDNGGGGNNAAVHTRNTASNVPFRGSKFDVWEGGIRIPMLMRWPGRLPAGKTFEPMVSSMDIFPTFVAAARTGIPKRDACDGVDLLPFLDGELATAPHHALCWQQVVWAKPNERRLTATVGAPLYNLALRSGSWKAVKQDQPFDGSDQTRAWELYDLARDPGEQHDVAMEFPHKVRELGEAFFAWQQQMSAPLTIGANPPNAN